MKPPNFSPRFPPDGPHKRLKVIRGHAKSIAGIVHASACSHGYDVQTTIAEIDGRCWAAGSTDFGGSDWFDVSGQLPPLRECMDLIVAAKPCKRGQWKDGYGRIVTLYGAVGSRSRRVQVQGILCTTPIVSALDRLLAALAPGGLRSSETC